MKTKSFFALIFGAIAIFIALSSPYHSQGEAATDAQPLDAIVAEIREQQVTMTENQNKIEEKLLAIQEDLRIARIFISRGGKAQ